MVWWKEAAGAVEGNIPCESVEVSEGVSGREGAVFSRMHLDFKQLLVVLHPKPTADSLQLPLGTELALKGKRQNKQNKTNKEQPTPKTKTTKKPVKEWE